MPRPTAAQLAYGSATVVLTTLAMLLLSGVTSVVGVAVIALVALCLGLLVSVKAVRPRRTSVAHPVGAGRSDHTGAGTVASSSGRPVAGARIPASSRR